MNMVKATITNLPENILHHVFSRLPFTSFITCRAVCKEWHAILSHISLLHSWIQMHNHYVSIHAQQEETHTQTNTPFLIIYEIPFPSSQLLSTPQISDNVRGLVYVYSPFTRRAYPFSTDMIGDDSRLVGIAEGDGDPFRVLVAAVKSYAFALAEIYGDAKNSWACRLYRFSLFNDPLWPWNSLGTGFVFFKGVFYILSGSKITTFDTRANRETVKNMVLPFAHKQIVWRRLNRWKSDFILTSVIVEKKEKGFNLKGMDVHSSNIDEWQIWTEDHKSTDNPVWKQIANMPSAVCGSFNDNSSGLSLYAEWESEVFGDYLFCKARGSKGVITFDLKTRLWNSVANCGEFKAECVQRFVRATTGCEAA